MKRDLVITIASLLSILLMTLHLADDVVRGMEPGGIKNLIGVLILAVWPCGTLALAEGRPRYVIILLGSLLMAGVPVVHMTGAGVVGGRIAGSSGVPLGVDAPRARGDRDLLRHSFSAGTLQAEENPVPVAWPRF